jgi:hypothetical protein
MVLFVNKNLGHTMYLNHGTVCEQTNKVKQKSVKIFEINILCRIKKNGPKFSYPLLFPVKYHFNLPSFGTASVTTSLMGIVCLAATFG